MSTFILTWNPAVSDFTAEAFRSSLGVLHAGEGADMCWPVPEDCRCGEEDRFFVLRTGGAAPGLCMAGYFSSAPYEDDDYDGTGTRFVADIDPLVMVADDGILPLAQLQAAVPGIGWEGLDGVTLIVDDEAGMLEDCWVRHLYALRDSFDGRVAAKSWNFELDNFESIPDHLQRLYKRDRGCVCEKCGKREDEVQEMAYHLVLDGVQPGDDYDSRLHCYCEECWFNVE